MTQRKSIAGCDGRFFRNHISLPHSCIIMEKHISFLSITINHKSNKTRAIRIIFYSFHSKRNIILVVQKINLSKQAFMAATLVPGGNATAIITAATASETARQRFLRFTGSQRLAIVYTEHVTTRIGYGFVRFHTNSILSPFFKYTYAFLPPLLIPFFPRTKTCFEGMTATLTFTGLTP